MWFWAHGIVLAHGIEKGAHGIEKRVNLYKEKNFIMQIIGVGARCLSLNEYFSLK